jgi:hypothetical protein
MAFVRKQIRGTKQYYYLVESKQEGPKVRQKVICYLGTTKPSFQNLEGMLNEIKRNRRLN